MANIDYEEGKKYGLTENEINMLLELGEVQVAQTLTEHPDSKAFIEKTFLDNGIELNWEEIIHYLHEDLDLLQHESQSYNAEHIPGYLSDSDITVKLDYETIDKIKKALEVLGEKVETQEDAEVLADYLKSIEEDGESIFDEQEAGKATINVSTQEKESAKSFDESTRKALKEIEELFNSSEIDDEDKQSR